MLIELCEGMDLTEEERKDELAPIFVQQIYALLKLGRLDDAVTLEHQFDTQKWAFRKALCHGLILIYHD